MRSNFNAQPGLNTLWRFKAATISSLNEYFKKYINGWFRAPLERRQRVLAVKPARADGGKAHLIINKLVGIAVGV